MKGREGKEGKGGEGKGTEGNKRTCKEGQTKEAAHDACYGVPRVHVIPGNCM